MTGMQGLGTAAGPLISSSTPSEGRAAITSQRASMGVAGGYQAGPADPSCPGMSPRRCSEPQVGSLGPSLLCLMGMGTSGEGRGCQLSKASPPQGPV